MFGLKDGHQKTYPLRMQSGLTARRTNIGIGFQDAVELATGVEPATCGLQSRCSAVEPCQQEIPSGTQSKTVCKILAHPLPEGMGGNAAPPFLISFRGLPRLADLWRFLRRGCVRHRRQFSRAGYHAMSHGIHPAHVGLGTGAPYRTRNGHSCLEGSCVTTTPMAHTWRRSRGNSPAYLLTAGYRV